MKVILASKSPRRQELMKYLFDEFEVFPSLFKERNLKRGDMAPFEYVIRLAEEKANEAFKRLDLSDEFVLISCDTVVVIDDVIFGKPRSIMDAFKMLSKLQGARHEVYTGICIILPNKEHLKFYVRTDVYFDSMSSGDIEEYLKLSEYKDKAGAYAIQGYGSKFITKIEGCYYNVMGFPINEIYKKLKENKIFN